VYEREVHPFRATTAGPSGCNQAGDILGFLPHEVVVLLKAGLLKPLGRPAPNGHKFFCTAEISALSQNREWLDKATRAVTKHWKERNLVANHSEKVVKA
jgi:hypothetical protein